MYYLCNRFRITIEFNLKIGSYRKVCQNGKLYEKIEWKCFPKSTTTTMRDYTILKRDGKRDRFSLDKIMTAIIKAFQSVGESADLGTISKIISHLNITDNITVEDIQNEVEEALMREGHFQVAKSFMLYRQKHTEDRETMERLKFLADYVDAANAATGSKYDANANVEHKNIATLIGELPKSSFIRLNRRLLTDRIKKMYGKELADEYIDKLTHHFIYKNDETSLANYCASITMYPWLIGGTMSIGGNSTAPTPERTRSTSPASARSPPTATAARSSTRPPTATA